MYQISVVDRYYRATTKVPKPIAGNPSNTVAVEQLITYREVTNFASWNPVASIVFASSLLHIIPTQTLAPTTLGAVVLI